MSKTKKDRYLKGPENETFNKLKGSIVDISMLGATDPIARVKLVWVDVYTMGVLVDPRQPVTSIVYKGPGMTISPAGISVEDWEQRPGWNR